MTSSQNHITVELKAREHWIPTLQSMVENSAPVFGLEREKTVRLVMAVEELFAHLSQTSPDVPVRVRLARGPAHVAVKFAFEAAATDLWAMNLTAASDITPGQSLDQLGLMLAARMVDRFYIYLKQRQVVVVLQQDMVYPEIPPLKTARKPFQGSAVVQMQPEPDAAAAACGAIAACYAKSMFPGFFRTPGKVVDMCAGDEFNIATATDATGGIVGMIAWSKPSEFSIGFYGPYVFCENGTHVARLLTEHLINRVARTPAMIVYSICPTGDLLPGHFERLDQLNDPESGSAVWYRLLREDMGQTVWAHASMRSFLEATYDRLVLTRTIQETSETGEARPDRSVFAADLNSELGEAVLTPMLHGRDAAELVQKHVALLTKEGFSRIYFHLDLAFGWQAAMGGILQENNFVPKRVLPHAGQSDLVVFQYVESVS